MTPRLHTVTTLRFCRPRSRDPRRAPDQPIAGYQGLLIGIITDRDLRDATNAVTTSAHLAGAAEAAPRTAAEISVEVVMTQNAITLAPHSSIITAAELMRRENRFPPDCPWSDAGRHHHAQRYPSSFHIPTRRTTGANVKVSCHANQN